MERTIARGGPLALALSLVLATACDEAERYSRDLWEPDEGFPGYDIPMLDVPVEQPDLAGSLDLGGPADPGLGEDAPVPLQDVGPGLDVDDPGMPPPPSPAWVPPDAGLRVSYATRDLPVPLGISTGGYGQGPGPLAPRSPFAEAFQATTTQWHPPRVQVIHVLKGDRRLLMVQCDLVAIFRTVHLRVVDEVRRLSGVDVGDVLLLAGNHSHTAPARIFDTPIGPIFSDTYEEQVFQRVTGAIAEAIVDALGQPAPRVRFGQATAVNAAMHFDRRCENGPLQDDTMQLMRFDRADGGGTVALVVNYALHGTVFAWQDGVLGGDAPRAVEMKVQEALPGAPPVLFFQSWTGDVAPADPRGDFPASDHPEAPLPALDRLEAIGRSGAETVLAAWPDFQWQDDPDLVVQAAVAPMTWEAIGYAPGEWDHPAGALLCGANGSVCGSTPPDMASCLDMDYGWVPDTVRLLAFRLGVVAGVTLPGEPHTALAQDLLARVRMHVRPAWKHLLFGYAQDYVGYVMLPDDWAGGGYEAGMALFGPKAAGYLRDAAASLSARLSIPTAALSFTPATLPAWAPGASKPYAAATSLDAGQVLQDLPATAVAGDVLTFRWAGGDPWVDQPRVVVHKCRADGACEIWNAGGVPLDQRGYRLLLSVEPTPPWSEPAPQGREFAWTARLRTAVRIPAPDPALVGTLRLYVKGQSAGPTGSLAAYERLSSKVAVGEGR